MALTTRKHFILWLLLPGLFACYAKADNPAYTGPIIDMHVHAYSKASGGMMFGMDHPNPLKNERYQGVASPEAQRLETFKQFDKYNVVLALTSDGHLWQEHDPERILISGRNMPMDELESRFKEGKLNAIGELNPFYGGITADHASQKPFFELAKKLGIPVGFHIMPGGPPGGLYTLGMTQMRVRNANPRQLEEVLGPVYLSSYTTPEFDSFTI